MVEATVTNYVELPASECVPWPGIRPPPVGAAPHNWALHINRVMLSATLLDDWGLAVLDDAHRRDLLEVLDDRHGTRSTIVTSQLKCGALHFSCNAELNLMRSPPVATPLVPHS
jgi:hypothetical protein